MDNMREILFRGKRTDNGGWVYGNYIKSHSTPNLIMIEDTEPTIERLEGPFLPGMQKTRLCFQGCPRVDPSTVGQYTGLTASGKRIFEGDVIQFHKYRDEPYWVGEVRYEHCSYVAVGRMPLAYEKNVDEVPYHCPFEVQLSGIDKTTINVIGNIHDNPELMEVDHDH